MMSKRILSIVLSIALCLGLSPAAAYAEVGDTFSGDVSDAGTGSSADSGELAADTADDAGSGDAGGEGSSEGATDSAEDPDALSEGAPSDGTESDDANDDPARSESANGEAQGLENSWRFENGELIVLDSLMPLSDVAPWSKTDDGYVNSAGGIIEGALYKGIDVSEHNDVIDWDAVAASGEVDFVIIRCGYGMDQADQDDSQWLNNVSACERLGIPYGVYLYSYADSVKRASSEADHVLRLLEGHSPDLPVYLDMEESSLADASNVELLASVATTFCTKVEAAGYEVGVYANLWWWSDFLTDPCFDQWDRWVAQYNTKCDYDGDYSLWQCTDGGTVDGVDGYVDINFAFKDILEGDDSNPDEPAFSGPYASIDALAYANRNVLADGSYVVMTDLADGQVLDVKSGSVANSANVQIYKSNMTLAQRWAVSHDYQGYLTLTCEKSGKVLDVKSAKAANGTNVQQYASNETRAQKWVAVPLEGGGCKLVSALSESLVLDVSGGKTANGTNVQIYSANSTNAQRWHFFSDDPQVDPCEDLQLGDGVYEIASSANPSVVLDVKSASVSDGANIQVYSTNGTFAQMYRFDFVDYGEGLGYYRIICAASGKALDVEDGNLVPGTNVRQWAVSDGDGDQLFSLVSNDDGSYAIISKSTGLSVGVAGGSPTSGSNVQLCSPSETSNQFWEIEAVENLIPEGTYTISSGLASSKVLDVKSGSTADAANVQIYASNGTLAQKWQVAYGDGGAITLECLASGLMLTADANGNVCQRVAKDDDTQLWVPSVSIGKIVLTNVETGKVLDVASAKTANGTNVQVYAANGTSAQSFVFSPCDPLAAGTYAIKSFADDSKALDVKSASTANGANVQLYASNNTGAQMWDVSRNSDGTYTILNVNSGKALDVKSASATSGANVQQYSSNSTAAQKWYIEYAGGGSFELVSALDASLLLTVEGGSAASGANVCIASDEDLSTQRFLFEKVDVRSAFVAVALSQANGKPSGGDRNKYNNYSGEPWCAYFVTWCARTVGASLSAIPNIYLCSSLKSFYKARGLWHGSGYTPEAGDIIFYSTYSGGTPGHVGVVTSCSNGTVYTKEGNVGSGVVGSRVRTAGSSYVTSGWYVVGYASPSF